jgi:membrane-associated protein
MAITDFLSMLLHVDKMLEQMLPVYGSLVYAILFAIIFAETGLVIFPFLPGDSLLFIAGAFCATGAMNSVLLSSLLILAAVSGNTVNYMIGRAIGNKAFTHNYRWLDRAALQKTHTFFELHGGKTIVLARWLPVVRTFAPFVAGVSQMGWVQFQLFNVSGAVLWVVGLITLGYHFGGIPIIRDHLNTIVLIGFAAAAGPVALAALWRIVKKARGQKS